MIVWFKEKTKTLLEMGGNPMLYIALLVVIMVLFTLYRSVVQISFEDVSDEAERKSDKPLIIIKNALINVFSNNGLLAYRITADSISQYEEPERSILDNSEIELLDENKQVIWRLKGKQTQYSSDQLTVEGDVTAVSLTKEPQIKLITERLQYSVEEDVVTLPVKSGIHYGSSLVQAGSGRIDIEENLFQFNNKVVMTLNAAKQ